uniref:Nose resistant-to-fluoxetine protein N-terminal domain-containing protein n=1 Tax=Timema shepardi TaxID=629360 RepID=A0A7R9ALB3_TIMSH|nr:unnamed protein product [Timema shepardi]
MKIHAVLRLAKNRRHMVIMIISLADSTEKNGTHLVTVLIAYLANALVVLSSTAEDRDIEVRISVGSEPPRLEGHIESVHFPLLHHATPNEHNLYGAARRGENKFCRAILTSTVPIHEPPLLNHVFSEVKEVYGNQTNLCWERGLNPGPPTQKYDTLPLDRQVTNSWSRLYVRNVRQFQLWALKMHDSSAKVPSGLLNGNVNQYGDYDQCLEVGTEPDHPVQGKYCLAYLDLDLKSTAAAVPETVKEVNTLLHSYHAMRSQFHDPGHRIPRFSAINWAFCLPSTCTAEDLQQSLQEAFEPYNNHTELALKVKVDPAMCYTRQGQPVTFTALCAILFFVAIIAATVIGTFRDYCNVSQTEDSTFWKLVKCFSLRRNWKTLSNTKSSPDDVKSVHGLRAINALALIMFHKSAAFQFNPYTNRTAMQWSLSLAWSIIGRTSIIYTDSFIMFSGLLTSYSFLKDLERNKCLNVWEKYLSRYIRFTPNLLAIILFCTYVMTHLGSGPQWNLVVQHHADICQETMWRNFLYIHNYFGFQNMCLTHTHQLGIDMQLFLISPLVVYLLWKIRWLGVLLILTVCWWSTALRYTVTYNNHLSTVVYFGVPVAKLFDTANLSYILPTHRATIYLIGVLVGYWLRNMRKIHLNKMAVGVGWTVAIALALLAMCGPYHMARLHYSYNPEDAALYNAWSPIVWSGFLIWVIFATEQGYGGVVGDLLRWKGFVVFTRVAYAVYLTQFPIFFYNVGTTRHSHYYRPYMLVRKTTVTP